MTNQLVDLSEFIRRARMFSDELRTSSNFLQVQKLWSSINLPYRMPDLDPRGDAYEAEVLKAYQQLAGRNYTTANEITSTKLPAKEFELGYPWISREPAIAAQELAKASQGMMCIAGIADRKQIIEFGSGWGNLAIPLSKLGLNVTVVDIDQGLIDRLAHISARDNLDIKMHLSDFNKFVFSGKEKFDIAIFQSSFHHCINFNGLLENLKNNILTADGSIIFLSEPVFDDYPFPWGLRYDGEAIWAIALNHWLELGFSTAFFHSLLFTNGFLLKKIPAVAGYVGEGWLASPRRRRHHLAETSLWSRYDDGLWPSDGVIDHGRFLRGQMTLPSLHGLTLIAEVKNFCPSPLDIIFTSAGEIQRILINGNEKRQIKIKCNDDDVIISSETWIPDEVIFNGDTRKIGVALLNIMWD